LNRQNIVIIGASSAIAEHCAREWVKAGASSPADFVLVGRDHARVQVVADDLRVRSPQSHIAVHQTDFNDPLAIAALVSEVAAARRIDIVLIAHGNLPQQHACEQALMAARDALLVNGISPVLFAEAFAAQLERQQHGTLAVIGSVAGDRGRKSNYVYGAAKGLVERYLQGLQHRFAHSAVNIVLIKPGPTAPPMTAHLPARGLASVDAVARRIVAGIAAGSPVVYAPSRWWLIMMVIRHLPRFIFNKLDI
jgi:short-subunit dehydrogenase